MRSHWQDNGLKQKLEEKEEEIEEFQAQVEQMQLLTD